MLRTIRSFNWPSHAFFYFYPHRLFFPRISALLRELKILNSFIRIISALSGIYFETFIWILGVEWMRTVLFFRDFWTILFSGDRFVSSELNKDNEFNTEILQHNSNIILLVFWNYVKNSKVNITSCNIVDFICP